MWTSANSQTAAVGLVRQGNKTLNISTTGEERFVRFLPAQKVEKLLRKLRQKPKFQEFESKLVGGITPVRPADPSVSERVVTLSPGQSAQVTLRFDPNESGNFTGNVQVGINGG